MIGNVGTAVVMFPILRRYSETLSLSYVASRTIEATIIGVGAIRLLSVVTLRDDLAASIGPGRTSLDITGPDPGRDSRLDVPVRADCAVDVLPDPGAARGLRWVQSAEITLSG